MAIIAPQSIGLASSVAQVAHTAWMLVALLCYLLALVVWAPLGLLPAMLRAMRAPPSCTAGALSNCSTWDLHVPMSRTRVSELMRSASRRYSAWLVAATVALVLWAWVLFDSSSELTRSRMLDAVERWLEVQKDCDGAE